MEDERIQTVPLTALHPHPRNAEFFDDADGEAFENLKESIANVGLLTPLRISKNYTIISGHQRYRACKELGVEYIPCIVDDGLVDENEMMMQLIVSNFGRMKNDPAKQGRMIEEYEKMMGVKHGGDRASGTLFRLKQEDVANKFGITARSLREYKRFAHMPVEVQEYVKTGKLSMLTAVRILDKLPVEDQLKAISSFPDTVGRITSAAIQQKVDELYAKEEKNLAEYQANFEEATAETQKQLQEKQRELDKQFTEAQEMMDKAEKQSATAQEQLDTIYRQIEKMQEKLDQTQSELNCKRSELAEMNKLIDIASAQATPPAPQTIYPADYEELKRKAADYDKVKKQLDNMQNSKPRIVTEHEACPMETDFDKGLEYFERMQTIFSELKSCLEVCTGNRNLIGSLSVFQQNAIAEKAIEIANSLNIFANVVGGK